MSACGLLTWPLFFLVCFFTNILSVSQWVPVIVVGYPVAWIACYVIAWVFWWCSRPRLAWTWSRIPLYLLAVYGISLISLILLLGAGRWHQLHSRKARFENPVVAALIVNHTENEWLKRWAISHASIEELNRPNVEVDSQGPGWMPNREMMLGTPLYVSLTIQDVKSARMIMERGGQLKDDEKEKIKKAIAGFEESPVLRQVFDLGELKPLMEKAVAP